MVFTFFMSHHYPIFTRFLYEKTEVTYSLTYAILENQPAESLFWACELYFSGWKTHLILWMEWMRLTFYAFDLGESILSLAEIEMETWILRMCESTPKGCDNYTMSSPMQVDLHAMPTVRIDDVLADHVTVCPARMILANMSLYAIRKEQCREMGKHTRNHLVEYTAEDYLHHWLYYASFSRVWKERIRNHGGTVNHTIRMVEFPTDETMEDFYDRYGYEPDEQPLEIHQYHGIIQ